MKLIFCPHCHDIKKLNLNIMTYCNCKRSYGRYIDNLHAEINEEAIPIGIANNSFVQAITNRPNLLPYNPKAKFNAFVIENNCPTITVIPNDTKNDRT